MRRATATALNVGKDEVLVASTGVIGAQLPMEKITKGIEMLVPELNDTVDGGRNAALAIMTTDTVPKEIAYEVEIGGKK